MSAWMQEAPSAPSTCRTYIVQLLGKVAVMLRVTSRAHHAERDGYNYWEGKAKGFRECTPITVGECSRSRAGRRPGSPAAGAAPEFGRRLRCPAWAVPHSATAWRTAAVTGACRCGTRSPPACPCQGDRAPRPPSTFSTRLLVPERLSLARFSASAPA